MDNFEWVQGFTPRLNYETLERIPKKSFYWYQKVIEENGI